jgi:site-specific DNA-methyltransferase (adenine-specific)
LPEGTPYIQPAQNTEWETPTDLFDALWNEFGGFDLDPCCTPDQYTAQRVLENGGTIRTLQGGYDFKGWYGPEDGLTGAWGGKVFMNSPYGLALRKWTAKAVHEVRCGNAELVVALVPSKTDTVWWHRYVLRMAYKNVPLGKLTYVGGTDGTPAEIRFIKGRLTFRGAPAPAGHASAIVVWRR